MNVSVLQEDIDNGLPGVPWACALALALQRVTGNRTMSVGRRTAGPDGDMHRWNLRDEDSGQFVDDFDKKKSVYPITFLNFGEESPELRAQQEESEEQ